MTHVKRQVEKKKLTRQLDATLLVSQGLDATTRVFTRNKRNRPPSLLLWWVLPVSHPLQLDTGHMGTRPAPFSTHVFHWCFPVHKLWRFLFDGSLNRQSLTFEMIFSVGFAQNQYNVFLFHHVLKTSHAPILPFHLHWCSALRFFFLMWQHANGVHKFVSLMSIHQVY